MMLNDVKVLDLSRLLPGPFCSLLLADMCADVLKIEDTAGGDYARYYPPFVDNMGAFFASINRNKRSIALNLKHAQGVEVLKSLVAESDVVLESFRPGVMDRLGVGYDALRAIKPDLIYCAITGYGQTGPMATLAGHDLNYLALSGVLEQNAAAGQAPHPLSVQVADIAGGALYAALGIVSALYQREKTGDGAFLDISMTEGALSFQLPTLATMRAEQSDAPPRGASMLTGGLPCYRVYQTSDGRYLSVGSLEPKFWVKLVTALGMPERASDGLATGEEGATVQQELESIFLTKTRDEWSQQLAALDVCCEPVLSPDEVLEHELFRARQMFFTLAGVQHTSTPLTDGELAHTPPPTLGQHTDDVLRGLGHDTVMIDTLRQNGAIG